MVPDLAWGRKSAPELLNHSSPPTFWAPLLGPIDTKSYVHFSFPRAHPAPNPLASSQQDHVHPPSAWDKFGAGLGESADIMVAKDFSLWGL